MHGLQELQEHHSATDEPGEQKKVLLGTGLRSRFPFAQKLLIKPENAQLLLPTQQHTHTHPNQHTPQNLTHSQYTTTTTLRAPWMTSRRRYNPDKKTPLSPLLSQLIQRLYSLNSHFHCLCEHSGRDLPCLPTTESGQGNAKARIKDGGGGALEVYNLSKSLLFSDHIENRSDLNLDDDGWVDASGSNGKQGGDGVGPGGIGMSAFDDDGAFELHDDGVDEDDSADADEALVDWDSEAYSTISDREDADHTMDSLQLERPYALDLNTNAANAVDVGDDFTHTSLTQGAMCFNDALTTARTTSITMWPRPDPNDPNPTATQNHAIPHSPSVEQAFTDMIIPSSPQPSTSASDSEDELLFLPPPTPRPRFIELLDTDMSTGTGSTDGDTGMEVVTEAEVDNDADVDFDTNADCSDPTPSIRVPVQASASVSASSSDSFPSSSEASSHHTIPLPLLGYGSAPVCSNWGMNQYVQQQQQQSHQIPHIQYDNSSTGSYKHSTSTPPDDEALPCALGSDSQDNNGVDFTSRPRTAHGLRPYETSFPLLSPPQDDGGSDNTNGICHVSANEDELSEAPRLEILSGNVDDGEEVEEAEDLNSGKEYEYDPDVIYLYDPFDLHSDSRRNGRGRNNMIPLQPEPSLSSSTSGGTSTSRSPSTSPSTLTSLSLSTPPFTSLSSPTNSVLFPPGLSRPPLRSSSPMFKKHKHKPIYSSYALSEKSQWKLAVAQYHRALSTRGMRHPGFPPSPLGPNWEKYYGCV